MSVYTIFFYTTGNLGFYGWFSQQKYLVKVSFLLVRACPELAEGLDKHMRSIHEYLKQTTKYE